jgi:hypothetical protein
MSAICSPLIVLLRKQEPRVPNVALVALGSCFRRNTAEEARA